MTGIIGVHRAGNPRIAGHDYRRAPFADDFNRPDGALEASPAWTLVAGTAGALRIVGGRVMGAGATGTYLSPDQGGVDRYVEVRAAVIGRGSRVILHWVAPTDKLQIQFETSAIRLLGIVGGSTVLDVAVDSAVSGAAGALYRFEVSRAGGFIRTLKDDALITTTAYPAGLPESSRCGLDANAQSPTAQWDDYRAGKIRL